MTECDIVSIWFVLEATGSPTLNCNVIRKTSRAHTLEDILQAYGLLAVFSVQ